MLRPTIVRKVLRVRALRQVARSLHESRLDSASGPLANSPALTTTGPDPSSFPLYRPAPPPPPPPRVKYPKDLSSLPSLESIERAAKFELSERATAGVDDYDERALRSFYKNLVLAGASEVNASVPLIAAPKREILPPAERREILSALAGRLLEADLGETETEITSASTNSSSSSSLGIGTLMSSSAPRHVAITAALFHLAPESPAGSVEIPLGIVRQTEWQALLDSFVARSDPTGAEVLFGTMLSHGVRPTTDQIDQVVEVYARRGETAEVGRLMSEMESAGHAMTNHHRDLLVTSYLQGPEPDVDGAIALLGANEKLGQALPQSAYHAVLSHLVDATPTSQPDARTRALAWDVFANMRFAAHPTPARELYNTMIRACGDAREPQPERARDLWIEMTTEGERIVPTREEYDAIIRALGSTKRDYLEAYDLLRQMLARHQEATLVPFDEVPDSGVSAVQSAWLPTVETFTALLEGTKRAGDLGRARWVLAEVIELAAAASVHIESTAATASTAFAGPDEELMAGVFMTYAAWKPLVRRAGIKEAQRTGEREPDADADSEPDTDTLGHAAAPGKLATSSGSSTLTMPRTSAEALREATALFEQIVHDSTAAQKGRISTLQYPFARVRLTPRLVNSYLSVHLAHAPTLTDAREAHTATWTALAADLSQSTASATPRPNGWTYLAVLERCARGRLPVSDREVARSWAWQTWGEYRAWAEPALAALADLPEGLSRRQRWLAGLGERQVERAWIAAIRLAALGDDTTRALSILDEFVSLYPARDLLDSYSPQLRHPDLAIRMSEPGTRAEPNVPPHVLFSDLSVLHARLVRDERWDGVAKVKWAATSYERALAKRKRWRVRGAGVRRELAARKRVGQGEREPRVIREGEQVESQVERVEGEDEERWEK